MHIRGGHGRPAIQFDVRPMPNMGRRLSITVLPLWRMLRQPSSGPSVANSPGKSHASDGMPAGAAVATSLRSIRASNSIQESDDEGEVFNGARSTSERTHLLAPRQGNTPILHRPSLHG
jgi:hypothetical protein